MYTHFFIGFAIDKETKQSLYCRKKKRIDYDKILFSSDLKIKTSDSQDHIGAYCASNSPTIRELSQRKKEIETEIFRILPKFRLTSQTLIMETLIGT